MTCTPQAVPIRSSKGPVGMGGIVQLRLVRGRVVQASVRTHGVVVALPGFDVTAASLRERNYSRSRHSSRNFLAHFFRQLIYKAGMEEHSYGYINAH